MTLARPVYHRETNTEGPMTVGHAGGGPISSENWGTFLKDRVSKAINELSPRFETDFQDFLKRHNRDLERTEPANLRRQFMVARTLYELFRADGWWGLDYTSRVAGFKNATTLLTEMAANARTEEGRTRPHLFRAYCAEVDYLFAAVATVMGLEGVEVRLVRDNHVNVFVPIGKAWLRIDPTPISDSQGRPRWDMLPNPYKPERGIPEQFDRETLKPFNRVGVTRRAEEITSLSLDSKAAEILLARLADHHEPFSKFSIPDRWLPVVRGMKMAKRCFEASLLPYTYPTLRDLAAARGKQDQGEKRGAENRFLACLDRRERDLEAAGLVLGYLYWGRCNPSPRGLSPLACMALPLGGLTLQTDRLAKDPRHGTAASLSTDERREIQEVVRLLDRYDPADIFSDLLGQEGLVNRIMAFEMVSEGDGRNLIPALASLVHLVDYHPSHLPLH